ncbi:MAG: DUF2244 domain-containing protein [Mangrovicoccus sp.]|nr:DUF2244 domain-containing protein [Mangrovicoccus sp.]
MPLQWVLNDPEASEKSGAFSYARGEPPYLELYLRAHKSLTPKGFVWFIAITFALILLPLAAVIGSPVLWGLLPFMLGVLALIWIALKASWRRKDIREELRLWSDRLELRHILPRGDALKWEANPHWVTLRQHPSGGPVPNYLTLSGGGREVELGAFLPQEERVQLYPLLQEHLTQIREA